jgi:hypothetical protein
MTSRHTEVFDGLPDKDTVQTVYDNLDFTRGVDVCLNTAAATSTPANIEGLKSVGCNNSHQRMSGSAAEGKRSFPTV